MKGDERMNSMYDKDDRPNRIRWYDVLLMIAAVLAVIAAICGAGYGVYRLIVHFITGV